MLANHTIFISAFQEKAPIYPGGIWILDGRNARPFYEGFGVFGMTWWDSERLLIGATRVDDPALLAFHFPHHGPAEFVPVRYERFIPSTRTHGIRISGDHLYVVATQGEPGSPVSSNVDRWAGHRVGKIIVSRVEFRAGTLTVRESRLWNPFDCDHHHHYNDILVDEHFIYLVSFSTCTPSRQLVARGAVSRFTRDLKLDSVFDTDLDSPHSLERLNERFFTCSSGAFAVRSFDAVNFGASARAEYQGIRNFLRGLIATDDWLLVGLSRSSGRTDAAHLSDSVNGVLHVSRGDGQAVRIRLPYYCENTYAILGAPVQPAPAMPGRRRSLHSRVVATARSVVRTLRLR